jgi:microcystin-dependent protein
MGSGHTLGERGGEQGHTLSISEVPQHTHVATASSADGNQSFASGNLLSKALNLYSGASNLTALNSTSISNVGGSQAHLNMQPFLVLNFSIALQGIFPSQT